MIADMQQSLRVSRQAMERVIRAAGSGLGASSIPVITCSGTNNYWPVQFSNLNTPAYADPITTFDATPGDADPDPDWIRIVSAPPATVLGGTADSAGSMTVTSTANFQVGDQFLIVDNSYNPPHTCVREVVGGTIQHTPTGSCANPPVGADPCIAGITTWPVLVRRLTGGNAVFRIGNFNGTPMLQVSFSPLGTTPANMVWQTIAENIEDLQVALVMDDGRVCGSAAYSVDDPALCDPTKVRAVRFTLTARSSSTVTGGVAIYPGGGYEDKAATTWNDGYLRRSITTEVQLRNQG
jgi:hypothetical protein